MEIFYQRPTKLRAKIKEVKAITLTSSYKYYDYECFKDIIRCKLLLIEKLKYCVHSIQGVIEHHVDGSFHIHGIVKIVNPVMLFKDPVNVKGKIDAKIGFCVIKEIDDMDKWLKYCSKSKIQGHLIQFIND